MSIFLDLKTHIVGRAPGILSALRQEGIPFSGGPATDPRGLDDAGVVLLSGQMSSAERERITRFVSAGGAIVLDEVNTDLITETALKTEECNIPSGCDDIQIYKYGKGCIVYVRRDLNRDILDTRHAIKEFITDAGTVRERVAHNSKSYSRWLLARALSEAYASRDLPFVKIWYYPYGYRSVFNFRFDVDEDSADDLERVMEASRDHKDCTSWFVSCFSFEKNAYKIKTLIDKGFDVQSHAYFHHTYRDKTRNLENIKRSILYFEKMEHRVEGFVAPKGRWNTGLNEVLEEMKFVYSSEFALDYDNFPFYPFCSNGFSKVLEIPVHPICLGLYMDSNVSEDGKILKYFEDAIMKKFYSNSPILLYGHPNERFGRKPELLRSIYEKAISLEGVWKVKMSDFAAWWNKRDKIEFDELTFDRTSNTLSYRMDEKIDFSNAAICIYAGSHKRAIEPVLNNRLAVNTDSLTYEGSGQLDSVPDRLYEEREYKGPLSGRFKGFVMDLLDWEKDTPVNELKRNTPRDFIKYQLRKRTVKRPVLRT